MRRREFIQLAAGAAALVAVPRLLRAAEALSRALPKELHPPQACCGLVTYHWNEEAGYYSADRIIVNGKSEIMDYRYHRFHQWLHRNTDESRAALKRQQYLAANIAWDLGGCRECGVISMQQHLHGCGRESALCPDCPDLRGRA